MQLMISLSSILLLLVLLLLSSSSSSSTTNFTKASSSTNNGNITRTYSIVVSFSPDSNSSTHQQQQRHPPIRGLLSSSPQSYHDLQMAAEILGVAAGIASTPLTSMAVARGMSLYHLAGCNARYYYYSSKHDQQEEWINVALYFPETFFPSSQQQQSRGTPVRIAVGSFIILFIVVLILSVISGYLSFFGWRSFLKCNCGWTDLEWWWALFAVSPIPKFFGLAIGLVGGYWFRGMGLLAGASERTSFFLDVVVLTIVPIVIVVSYGSYFFFNTFRPVLSAHHGTAALGVAESLVTCDAELLATLPEENNDDEDDIEENERSNKKKKKQNKRKKRREQRKINVQVAADDEEEELEEEEEEEEEEIAEEEHPHDNKDEKEKTKQVPKKWQLKYLRFLNSALGKFIFIGDNHWESATASSSTTSETTITQKDARKKSSKNKKTKNIVKGTSQILIERCGESLLTRFMGLERITDKSNLYSENSNNSSRNTSPNRRHHHHLHGLDDQLLSSSSFSLSFNQHNPNLPSSSSQQQQQSPGIISIRRSLTPYSYFIHVVFCVLVCFLSGVAQTALLGNDKNHPQVLYHNNITNNNINNDTNNQNDDEEHNADGYQWCQSIQEVLVFFEVIHILFFLFNHLYLRPVQVPMENFLNGIMDLCILVATVLMTQNNAASSSSSSASTIQRLLAGSIISCCCLLVFCRLFSVIVMKVSNNARVISQWRYSEFMLNQFKHDEHQVVVVNNNSGSNLTSSSFNNNTSSLSNGSHYSQQQQQQQPTELNINNNDDVTIADVGDDEQLHSGLTPIRHNTSKNKNPTSIDHPSKIEGNKDDDKNVTTPTSANRLDAHRPAPLASNISAYFPVTMYYSPVLRQEQPPPQQSQRRQQQPSLPSSDGGGDKKKAESSKVMWEKEFEDIDQALRNAEKKGDSKSASQFKEHLDKLFPV